MSKMNEEECKELWGNLAKEAPDCMGPGGINKSLAVVAGVNITLGMIAAVGGVYYYFTKVNKD